MRLFPHPVGLIQGDQRVTWSQIERRVNAMASALKSLGVRKGERILLQSRNNQQMFESCWAAFRLGCVWVPTNFRLTPPEIAYLGTSSGASVMIAEAQFEEHIQALKAESENLKHVIRIAPVESAGQDLNYESLVAAHLNDNSLVTDVSQDDPLWFFYTSGTTGKPKAAILTHGQMAFVVTNHLADLIPGTTQSDCSIAVAPLSHGAGIHALLNLARGAATCLMSGERLDPTLFGDLWKSTRSVTCSRYRPLSSFWWSMRRWTAMTTPACAMSLMRAHPCIVPIKSVHLRNLAR